jgi:phosphatidylinositol N-acetylglucosaminyltransferase subunit Q
MMSNGLLRVFWPSDIPRSASPGVIVGWRNSESDVFVLSIFEEVEHQSVENSLRVGSLYRNSPHPMARIFHLCGRPSMKVLGSTNPKEFPTSFSAFHLYAFTHSSAKYPQIFCPAEANVSVQVIIFDRPHPTRMQYMSLNPISLVLGDKSAGAEKSPVALDSVDAEDETEKARLARLAEKLRLHTVIRHSASPKELGLPAILNQVNCSFEMGRLLEKNISLIGTRSKRSLSVSERVVESATTLWEVAMFAVWHIISLWIYPVLTRIFVVGLICHRIVAEVILQVLEWRLRPEGAALKDISATAQQVDIRLQQFCYWPIQYLTLRRRKDDWESVTKSHPDYIRFYNSLWLVANDVIIGIALGSYIIDNADWVAYQINIALSGWTVEGLQRMISWLMDWPAGLKLNNELAAFLGDLFLWVIEHWAGQLSPSNVKLS